MAEGDGHRKMMHVENAWSRVAQPASQGGVSKEMSKAPALISNAEVPLCKAPGSGSNDGHQGAAHKS